MARRRVPRLSEHYECWALYWHERGMEISVWFYLFAAWFYEDEDEKEWTGAHLTPEPGPAIVGAH